MRTWTSVSKLIFGLSTLGLIAAVGACDDDDETTPTTTATTTSQGGSGGSGGNGPGGSGGTPICAVTDGVDGFGLQHVVQQGYWYSRYNMLSLNMQSSNGETFMPASANVTMMITMASGPTDTAMMPPNPALLMRVYDYGDPLLANVHNGNNMDFINGRWTAIPTGDQTTTTAAAWGWTLIKILEWNKQFHVDDHFGLVTSDTPPAAQQRFAGLALFAEAMNMTLDWMNVMANYDSTDLAGRYIALMSMADLATVLMPSALPHSATNRYRDLAMALAPQMGFTDLDDMMGQMMTGMGTLFGTLTMATNLHDCAIAVQALAWYRNSVTDKTAADALLVQNADALIGRTPANAAEAGYLMRGAVEAWRVTSEAKYLDAAAAAYQDLQSSYDCANGVFSNQATYTPEDVAGIVGGLNAALVHAADAHDDIDFDNVEKILTGFWEGTVNIGGLQVAAPPVMPPFIPDYEKLAEDLLHRYPTTPMPPAAGGANGTAPVFAKSVTFDPDAGSWTVDKSTYSVAGSMHLSNEALWLHNDEVSGFPAP